jgi:hypothetical protein
MVEVPGDALANYRRFSLYNSPYPAHDRGCAIDLYPAGELVVAPVSGTVRDVWRVGAPSRPDAADRDTVLAIELDRPRERFGLPPGAIARILHVDPVVDPGETVGAGDALGRLVNSGFFAPWVDPHLHLEFRGPDVDPRRARGSLPVEVGLEVEGVRWDGTGTVLERLPSAVVLDAPAHPAPGEQFVALAAADGTPLDGGLVHYAGGGALGADAGDAGRTSTLDGRASLSLLDCPIGTAEGRQVRWADVAVLANGEQITGLSLFAARDRAGVKLVWPDHDLAVGDEVTIDLVPTDEPIVLSGE